MMLIDFDMKTGCPWSQLPWHVGELFPVNPAWVDHVERVYLDGEELSFVAHLDPQGRHAGKYNTRTETLEGVDAQRVVRILRIEFPWVEARRP